VRRRSATSIRAGCTADAGERGQVHKLEGVDALQVCRERAPRRTIDEASGEDVFLHRQTRETPPPLQHLHDAAAHEAGSIRVHNTFAAKTDSALHHLAMFGAHERGNCLQRLAGTVGAEQRNDCALGHLQ
jgi:hypothetical protein